MRHLRFQHLDKTKYLKLVLLLIYFIQEHRGDWKCHLANTDLKVRVNKLCFSICICQYQDQEVFDEEVISVVVGVSAVVDISVEGDLEHVTEGESVAVECVIIEEGVPPVTVRLHHEQHGGDIQELGDGAKVVLEPTLSDTGSGEDKLKCFRNIY